MFMGIETSLAGKGKGGRELAMEKNRISPHTSNKRSSKSEKTKKSRKGNNSSEISPPTAVQKLFDTCKDVFANSAPGIVPPPEGIRRLKALLDDIKPDDFGLSPEMPYFQTSLNHKKPVIRYLHLHECDQFSMGIFCLPQSGVIPLHNHPGMTVFSKLLFGTMHIKSYDWFSNECFHKVDFAKGPVCEFEGRGGGMAVNGMKDICFEDAEQPEDEQADTEIRLAKVKVDSRLTAPCNTSILYPTDGGNMHRFTALTDCALLDVLSPPYSDPDGRSCQYYNDFPFRKFPVDGFNLPEEETEGSWWLQKREKPEDLTIIGEIYDAVKFAK